MLPISATRQYRTKLLYPFLIETTGHPHGTPVDCLIIQLSNQKDISYLYVTHDVQSGFVTRKKKKKDKPTAKHEESE